MTINFAATQEAAKARIARSLAAAKFSNPVSLAPLVGSVARAASTAVVLGALQSNGGKAYECVTAGTTSAGAGPSGRGLGITDGTVVWDYVGPQTAPVVYMTGTLPGGLTQAVLRSDDRIRYGGGSLIDSFSYTWVASFDKINSAIGTQGSIAGFVNKVAAGSFAEVETDAPIIAFAAFKTTTAANFLVEELGGGGQWQYVGTNWLNPSWASGLGYYVLDFTNAGGRKPRRIRLDTGGLFGYSGVSVGPNDTVSRPSLGGRIRLAALGDSWVFGQTQSVQSRRLATVDVACHLLGIDDVVAAGASSTGYVATTAAIPVTFAQRAADVASVGQDIVLIHGGANDIGTGVGGGPLATLQAVRALTNKPIFITGPNAHTAPLTAFTQMETDIAAAVATFADPLTVFLPTITDPAGAWISGTGNTGAPTGSGNASLYVGASNHLNDVGYLYYGRRLAEAMRAVLQAA